MPDAAATATPALLVHTAKEAARAAPPSAALLPPPGTPLAVVEELQEGCVDLSLITPPVVGHTTERAADACLGPQKNKVDRPDSPAELAPVAMLDELKETPARRTSKRRANSLDEHSLDRAQRLAAMRNLDAPKGRGRYFTRRRIGTPSQQRVGPWNQPLWRSSRGMSGNLEIDFACKSISLSHLMVVFNL
ncbi:hypothetical protein C2845_PM05G00910 [Panicum miliaceum]|uniref:Uncharacterized protein n=1 Tax=Panicum miliaceum TaxID=4540 RepID=A0A3L6T5T6_PANMI|nr:hypothetical protein C2845_PM05G00910 [Panicum miliaceum]